MFRGIASLRWRLIKTNITAAALVAFLFAAGLQGLWPVLGGLPPLELSFALTAYLGVLLFSVNIYYAHRESKVIKKRLDNVVAFTAVLSRGNLSSRIEVKDTDEIGRLGRELDGLAIKIEKQVDSLQRLADNKEKLAAKVHSSAIVEERQRLARELHDAVSQQLFALSMLSEAAAGEFERDLAQSKAYLLEIGEVAARAQSEMRALLLHLRPVQLAGAPLAHAIEELVSELEAKGSLQFEKSIHPLPPLSSGVENHLFRIVQEALANILRHANATLVRVSLYEKNGELFLRISDNGKGFDINQDKKTSYGLKMMRERSDEIGGVFFITSRENEGTHINVRVPLKEEEEN